MAGWIVALAIFLFFLVALYRAYELKRLIDSLQEDLEDTKSAYDIKCKDYSLLEKIYNQMIDTGLDLGVIIETSSGYLWRRPEMARGQKPQLATHNGKKVR